MKRTISSLKYSSIVSMLKAEAELVQKMKVNVHV